MCLQHVLFDTVVGDALCWGLEQLTGCALVPLSDLDYEVQATEKGITQGKRHNARAAHKIRRRGRQIR